MEQQGSAEVAGAEAVGSGSAAQGGEGSTAQTGETEAEAEAAESLKVVAWQHCCELWLGVPGGVEREGVPWLHWLHWFSYARLPHTVGGLICCCWAGRG